MIPRQILKFISSTPLFSTAQEEDRCNLEDFEETEMHSLLWRENTGGSLKVSRRMSTLL